MSEEQRIKQLEDMVHRLKIETWVLRQLMKQQVVLNNKQNQGSWNEVIARVADHYAKEGLENGDNGEIHDTLLEYLQSK